MNDDNPHTSELRNRLYLQIVFVEFSKKPTRLVD